MGANGLTVEHEDQVGEGLALGHRLEPADGDRPALDSSPQRSLPPRCVQTAQAIAGEVRGVQREVIPGAIAGQGCEAHETAIYGHAVAAIKAKCGSQGGVLGSGRIDGLQGDARIVSNASCAWCGALPPVRRVDAEIRKLVYAPTSIFSLPSHVRCFSLPCAIRGASIAPRARRVAFAAGRLFSSVFC